jgi:hypothetical protein
VLVVPSLVWMFTRVHTTYEQIGAALRIGKTPPPPQRRSSLVVVPVRGMSLLTEEAVSAALSLGDEVVAVTVSYTDPDDEVADAHFREQWEAWHPNVQLLSLPTMHRSIGPPIVEYLHVLEQTDKYHRLVVLIPEVQARKPWRWVLHNQRGFILSQAIQKGTSDVVICRLRFRLDSVVRSARGSDQAGQEPPADSGAPA